jgi:hypothetical protein
LLASCREKRPIEKIGNDEPRKPLSHFQMPGCYDAVWQPMTYFEQETPTSFKLEPDGPIRDPSLSFKITPLDAHSAKYRFAAWSRADDLSATLHWSDGYVGINASVSKTSDGRLSGMANTFGDSGERPTYAKVTLTGKECT